MSKKTDIKQLRTEMGLSQAELGAELGVDQSTVARWERTGKVRPMVIVAIEALRASGSKEVAA